MTRVQGYGLTETNAYVCSIAGADYLLRVSRQLSPTKFTDRWSKPDSTSVEIPLSSLRS
jgi:hypothetical protein